MAVERHFLGWDASVTTKVQQFLLPSHLSGPIELENQLIVVPTRQAGRRLREALAVHCAEQSTALLSPHVVTPTFFEHPAAFRAWLKISSIYFPPTRHLLILMWGLPLETGRGICAPLPQPPP